MDSLVVSRSMGRADSGLKSLLSNCSKVCHPRSYLAPIAHSFFDSVDPVEGGHRFKRDKRRVLDGSVVLGSDVSMSPPPLQDSGKVFQQCVDLGQVLSSALVRKKRGVISPSLRIKRNMPMFLNKPFKRFLLMRRPAARKTKSAQVVLGSSSPPPVLARRSLSNVCWIMDGILMGTQLFLKFYSELLLHSHLLSLLLAFSSLSWLPQLKASGGKPSILFGG